MPMSDLAIRVENPCPERSRRISKLYPSSFDFAQDAQDKPHRPSTVAQDSAKAA